VKVGISSKAYLYFREPYFLSKKAQPTKLSQRQGWRDQYDNQNHSFTVGARMRAPIILSRRTPCRGVER
jgi:hypothetical protein